MTITCTVCFVDYHENGNLFSQAPRPMQCLIPNFYKSPSRSAVVNRLENKLLAADNSWWTSRYPLYARVVAEVPRALYLNFLANRSLVAFTESPSLSAPRSSGQNEHDAPVAT